MYVYFCGTICLAVCVSAWAHKISVKLLFLQSEYYCPPACCLQHPHMSLDWCSVAAWHDVMLEDGLAPKHCVHMRRYVHICKYYVHSFLYVFICIFLMFFFFNFVFVINAATSQNFARRKKKYTSWQLCESHALIKVYMWHMLHINRTHLCVYSCDEMRCDHLVIAI